MVDWTVLGVAIVASVGTVGAGVIGFAGPSWNESRIQAARDRKALRQAIRLVKFELDDTLHGLRTRDPDAPAALGEIRDTFKHISRERPAWKTHRDTVALLADDQMTWQSIANFHNMLDMVFVVLDRPSNPPSAAVTVVTLYPGLIVIGEDAGRRLEALT